MRMTLNYLRTRTLNVVALLLVVAVFIGCGGQSRAEWKADHPCDNHQFYVEHRKTVCEGIYPKGNGPKVAEEYPVAGEILDEGFDVYDLGGR